MGVNVMRWKVYCIAWLFILSGCATRVQQPILGEEVAAPYGWQQWCLEHKEDKDCYLN